MLDEDHYGLEKVKERIIEFLAVRQLAPDIRAPCSAWSALPGPARPASP